MKSGDLVRRGVDSPETGDVFEKAGDVVMTWEVTDERSAIRMARDLLANDRATPSARLYASQVCSELKRVAHRG